VAERFEVYSYEVRREGLPPEMRYSLTPVKGARYSGRGEPLDANPLADDPAEADQPEPAGHVEAPDGDAGGGDGTSDARDPGARASGPAGRDRRRGGHRLGTRPPGPLGTAAG
jgi:hypothetical protein